ncbi:MAG: arginine--tRNA ligase [Rickettsiales bacterium]
MNIYKKINDDVKNAIVKLQKEKTIPEDLVTDKVDVVPSKDIAHGELATNVAMVLAAQVGKKPRELAELFVSELKNIPEIEKLDIAGAGFINMTLRMDVWQKQLTYIIESAATYGSSDIGNGRKVNVEYVSANPTGPMHVGHGRGAVFGDALSSLLQKAGYDITREYYINDAGAQIDKLADSVFLRYREVCGEDIGEIPEGMYPGEYLIGIAEGVKNKYGSELLNKSRDEWLDPVKEYTIGAIMEIIKDDLAALGIKHDVFSSEKALTKAGKVEEALSLLTEKGLIYEGVLEPPKGKTPDDWEERPQTLFKATQFGDDCDRALKKSDGNWTYLAPDIAYHFDKCRRGFDWLINIFGADHGGYIKRLKAAVSAFSDNKVTIDIKLCQLVKFLRDGNPMKMSKRAGTFVTVREVVDEVGKDVFRFIMLTRKNDAHLDFDLAKVMEQSKDNPVFYVQYAHARTRSIYRNSLAELPEAVELAGNPNDKILSRLSHPKEIEIIRMMSNWPRIIESSAHALEPHRIAFYLQDLAASFHSLWNLGNSDNDLRFIIKDDIELTAARIVLARSLSIVIASGLIVLGVEPAEEMR